MTLTTQQRDRIATPTVAVYWLMLVIGLALYTSVRSDEPYVTIPIWIGALGGTVLGQALTLRDYRLWVTAFVIIGIAVNGTSLAPVGVDAMHFWLAFVPAAMCGALSLGERAPLVAFWFPTVIWMLSILDRTDGQAIPGGVSAMLLGVLAVMFVAFLHVRESRRIALWRTIGAVPLAKTKPGAVLLRESPGSQLGRAGWGVLLAGITFALTAWVAPRLWQLETFGGAPVRVAAVDPAPGDGPPCCPREDDIETERSRVKEYFDLGRGHDRRTDRRIRTHEGCVMCLDDSAVMGSYVPGGRWYGGRPEIIVGGGGTGGGGTGTGTGWGEPSTVAPSEAPSYHPPVVSEAPAPTYTPDVVEPLPPTHRPKPMRPRHVETPPPSPPPPPAPPPPPTPAPQEQPPQVVETPQAKPPEPPPAPPPPVVAEAPRPTPRPTATTAAPRAPQAAQLPAPTDAGGTLLRWIILLVTAGLLSQILRFALRPIRRLVTLRHLRRPLWRETIDQQISNSWQLVLIGLRDAGWRTSSTEAPREFAKRVTVDGVEPCAQILERARHGIGIDASDLTQMSSSADTAYRSAHQPLGFAARLVAWLRWPLA